MSEIQNELEVLLDICTESQMNLSRVNDLELTC